MPTNDIIKSVNKTYSIVCINKIMFIVCVSDLKQLSKVIVMIVY